MPYLFVVIWHTENYEKTHTDYSEHELFLNTRLFFEHGLFFLNTDYFFWTRITRIFWTRIIFLNTNSTNNTYFLNTNCFFWTRIPRITRIFFDWNYCEAIKYSFNSSYSCSNILFVLFELFVFKTNRIFRVQIIYSCSKKIGSFVFVLPWKTLNKKQRLKWM